MRSKKSNPSPDSYAEINRRMGLSGTESTHNPEEFVGQSITYSSDSLESDIPPRLVLVESIGKLREIMANASRKDNQAIRYPDPYTSKQDEIFENATSTKDLFKKLDSEARENIKRAALVFVHGNAEKVKKYEPLINVLMFPMTIAYFAANKNLVIDKEYLITGNDPVVWNYDTITFKQGGSITASTEFTINCVTMSKARAS